MVPNVHAKGSSPKVSISSILNNPKSSPPVLPVSALRASDPNSGAAALPRRMEPPLPSTAFGSYVTPSPPSGTLNTFIPSPTYSHAYGAVPHEYSRPYVQQWPGVNHMYTSVAYPYMGHGAPQAMEPAHVQGGGFAGVVPKMQPQQMPQPLQAPVQQLQNAPVRNGQVQPQAGQPAGRIQKGRRFRRRYYQIHRKYKCFQPGCTKSYGSLNHLNTHIVTKRHGQRKSKADFKHIEEEEASEQRSDDEKSAEEEKERSDKERSESEQNPPRAEWTRPAETQSTHKGFTLPSLSVTRETTGRLPSLPSIVGQCTFTA